MSLTNEDIVTNLLSEKEIIKGSCSVPLNHKSEYNLGDFLRKIKNTPSVYDVRYKFIR